MKGFLYIVLIVCCVMPSKAQDVRNIFVDRYDNGKVLSEFLKDVEEKHAVDFLFNEDKMRAQTILRVSEKVRLIDYLQDYLPTHKVVKVRNNVVVILDRMDAEQYGIRKENFFVLKKQNSSVASVNGTIKDGRTNESLLGVQVFFPEFQQGTLTDGFGKFITRNTLQDILLMDVSYVGYEPNKYVILFSHYGEDESMVVAIFPASKQLESVVVTADRIDENVTSKLAGIEKLGIEAIKNTPAFLGEVDPIRSLTTLPGVSTSGELTSGFNVRGGENGQNLILQDGAVIYNPSHLFGFFSAFNPDIVNSVTLYKGGGPANFGGRIASVLNISLRNGDVGKYTVSGGVGVVSSRLAIEGPIVRNKSSFILGGRMSYCNWLLQLPENIQLKSSSAKFHDLTGSILQSINENNFLTLSVYDSYDAFKLAGDSVYSWGTRNYSLKWDHTFSDRLYSELNFANSNYFSEVNSTSAIDRFTYRNAISNFDLMYNLTYTINDKSKIVTGLKTSATVIEPGKLEPDKDAVNVKPENMNDQRSVESVVYVQGGFELSSKWSISAGLRFSSFLRLGADDVYIYDYSDMQGRYPAVVDTVHYSKGELIREYHGFEPRISVSYMLSKEASLKASYYRGFQYLHLISNTTAITPQDYWIASGPYLKPEIGNQVSLGFFRNLKNNSYEVSAEIFYKVVANAVDYIEGADITLNPILDSGLPQGKGLAYGLEVLVIRNVGKLNGSLAYTYSRSLRKFASHGSNMINNGEYYPATFDQPNNVSLTVNYRLNSKCTFSANFNYSTGRPITIPISKFSYDAYLSVLNYSERNEYRIPDYHRLDFSLVIKDDPKRNRRIKSEWVISIFNVYGRKNTYSIYFDRYGTAKKLSILGSVFPSLTYNFKF